MLDLKPIIQRVEALLANNTAHELTYAAIECRLAIELICYDRLRFSHDYISPRDISNWTPNYVVRTLIQEIDPNLGQDATLHISKDDDLPERDLTQEEYEALDWEKLGTQSGVNAKELSKLHHALSHNNLHVRMPVSSTEDISMHRDAEKYRSKVREALALLKRFEENRLQIRMPRHETTFECFCGQSNKRYTDTLHSGKIVRCANPECIESFSVSLNDGDATFERQEVVFTCYNEECRERIAIPKDEALKLEKYKVYELRCTCQTLHLLSWRLALAKPDEA